MKFRASAVLTFVLFLTFFFSISVLGQQPASRITQRIDNARLKTLRGSVHPLARAEFDRGVAPDSTPARRMLLLLSRSSEQETALHKFLDDQQTAGSPNYHRWLTPEEFGQMFGPTDIDVQTVTTWLMNSGFQVDKVSPGRTAIEFSGSAGQLKQVFRTELHKYMVGGKTHWANANDPQIPEALAPVVQGFVSLNDFPRKSMAHKFGKFKRDPTTGKVSPLYTLPSGNGNYYALGPGDLGVIYNSTPLLQAGNDGTGQTIAIVGETNINPQDITDFRNMFGLSNTPDNHTSVILNGPDPGIVSDEVEALLDTEWSGATAPGAHIVLVTSQSTETTSGVDLSALYIIDNDLAPVMSMSYGSCEFYLGNAGNQFFQAIWEQAAAQGITVVVSSGDNGSAGCDDQNQPPPNTASHGLAVSGLASTPFNVAAGGTDFNDIGTQTTYFNSTNTPGTLTSAKGYVPEMTWNESCAGGTSPTTSSCTSSTNLQLWAGSGGPSNCSTKNSSGVCQSGTAKPSWQTGSGVPVDGRRDVPDISVFSATGGSGSRSFYVLCDANELSGLASCQLNNGPNFIGVGGTSAAAPIFAGVVALANQKTASRLGNINYMLYSIAAKSGSSCTTSSTSTSCVFRDVATGGISVPCAGGSPNCSTATPGTKGVLVDSSNKLAYMAGAGYDRATGLGSVNITNLVNAIVTAKGTYTATTTSLTLNGGTSLVTAAHGVSVNVGVNVTPTAATGDVSILANNKSVGGATLNSGAASWSTTNLPGGNYNVVAHYAGDGTRASNDSNAVSVSISPENSKTFAELVTFDLTTGVPNYAATSTSYGAPYILRFDVGDSAATISSSLGVNSKCASATASCPTGTLTVTANGAPLSDHGNNGVFPLNNIGYTEFQSIQFIPGSYNIVANYPGDASYNSSIGTTTLTVGKASTSISTGSTQSSPYEYGAMIPLSAIVGTLSSGVSPTGTVAFYDNGAPFDPHPGYQTHNSDSSSPASYTASGAYPFGTLGSNLITTQYSGDSNYLGSPLSTAFALNVTQATTGFYNYSVVPNTTTPSIPVTLSATINTSSFLAQPTGTITFFDNNVAISGTVTYTGNSGSWVSQGGAYYSASLTAKLTYPVTTLGNHTITATYSGDTFYKTATTGPIPLSVVNRLPVSMTVSPGLALINAPVDLIGQITQSSYFPNAPTITGTVTFTDNGTSLPGTVNYSGNGGAYYNGILSTTFTTLGNHTIVANYSGDSNYASATATTTLNVLGPFSLGMVNSSATIGKTGGTGSAQLAVTTNNGFTGQVTFTCSSVPATATCSVSPSPLPITNYYTNANVNYTIPVLSAAATPQSRPFLWKTAGGLVLGCMFCFLPGLRRRNRILLAMTIVTVGLVLTSCGGGGSTGGGGGGGGGGGPTSQVYTLTITGTGSDNSVATTKLTITQQ